MSIKRLPFFLSAAKYLNFTEAANEQFISQTAMSLQIKKYEEELGFKLFNRSNTGVTLTKAGGYLYKRCQYITADYNRLSLMPASCRKRISHRCGSVIPARMNSLLSRHW